MTKTGQKQEKTEWHRIVVWGKLGELCNQYLAKGRQAFLEGKIQTRSWEDKNGQKRYTTEVVASSVQFIGGPSDRSQAGDPGFDQSSQGQGQGQGSSDSMNGMGDYQVSTDSNFTADDIPF